MRVWSVELEKYTWADDTFTGTFDECINYCKRNGYKIDGKEARLADIELDDNGCFDFCYEIVAKI